MTKRGRYIRFLEEEGYQPEDVGSMVVFKSEGLNYLLPADEEDEEFFQLFLPNFYRIETEKDRQAALRVVNDMTRYFKVVKVLLLDERGDEGEVWAVVEEFLPHPDDFKLVFRRALQALAAAAREFSLPP